MSQSLSTTIPRHLYPIEAAEDGSPPTQHSSRYPYPGYVDIPTAVNGLTEIEQNVWFFYFPASIPTRLVSDAALLLPANARPELHEFLMDEHMHALPGVEEASRYLKPSITVPHDTNPLIIKKTDYKSVCMHPDSTEDDLFLTDDAISFYVRW